MRAAGLQPRIDPAGNIFARRAGLSPQLPPILFGSHIDSVPNGGNFDGDLGSLSALGTIEALDAAGVRTRHPLEMVVWAHEESYAFGRGLACSRIVAGDVTPADMDEVWNGLRRGDAIRKIGGDPDRIRGRAARKGRITAISSCTSSRAGRSSAPAFPDRRRRRHRRDRSIRGDDHGRRQPLRHDADRRPARRAAGGLAPDDRGP